MTAKLVPGLIKTRREGDAPRMWQRVYGKASPGERVFVCDDFMMNVEWLGEFWSICEYYGLRPKGCRDEEGKETGRVQQVPSYTQERACN